MAPIGDDHRVKPFAEKMTAEDLPEQAIATFLYHLRRYLDGASGTLDREQIAPVPSLPDADTFTEFAGLGAETLGRVAVIKLNGGLGTGMGLDSAKSLLNVRGDLTFLDLIAHQIQSVRRDDSQPVPLLLMNSFRTEQDTHRVVEGYADLEVAGLPLGFLQHRVPKILVEGNVPADHSARPELEWCPPGHGDLYTALSTSGTLRRLLDFGIEYAFVSNADNLGAVLDLAILGYMVDRGANFIMEAADRTLADRKGGHLCRLADGRLALRESAQCPADEKHEFQDVDLYRYFNTNNLWVHLPALDRLLTIHGGVLPLDTIVNHKPLDPRDPSSPPVVQLETAMGSAISLFDASTAVRVSRRRFSPVKNTNDLLGVRSDAFQLTDDFRVVLHPDRIAPPVVSLDSRYYKMIDDFQARFPDGPPSLLRCESFTVEGDVVFGSEVEALGDVRVTADDGKHRVEDGSLLTGEVALT